MNPLRIGVLLSGGGRTLQNLLDRSAAGRLDAAVVCVAADRAGCLGIERAQRAELPTLITKDMDETFAFLRAYRAELVCLAGYLRLLRVPTDFAGRVLNIHPALLPKYGGKGFWGEHVHKAVLAAGDTESGCTVHAVDAEYDSGAILLQRRVPVLEGDTVDSLAARVFAAECEAYPEAIALWRATHR